MVVEAAFVDHVGGFLAALGDDMIGTEAIGGGSEVGEWELRERRHVYGGEVAGIFGAVGGRGNVVVIVAVLSIGVFGMVRYAATHYLGGGVSECVRPTTTTPAISVKHTP